MIKSTYEKDNKEYAFEFNDNPKFQTIINIVEEVASSVINDTVGYAPYLFEYSIDYHMAKELTNVELPEDVNKCYEFLNTSGISGVTRNQSSGLYDFISENAKDLIEYKKQQSLKTTALDELFESLINLVNKFGSQFEGLDMNDILSKWNSTVDVLGKSSEKDIVKAIIDSNK